MGFSSFFSKSTPSPRISPLRPQKPLRWSRFAGAALVLLAAAAATAPQLIRGPSCGHDFDIHLVSWLDCLNGWRHGLIDPHWAASANYGAGEPRFVFYPPLTWMLGAALGFVLPWALVPAAMTFLLLAGTGLATRRLALEALDDGAGTLAGCAALFSGYALFTAYERSAFGELTGGFWIPLLLLLILGDRNRSAGPWKRALDGSATPLALVVAGAWLSNAPLGVMAVYLLAAVALAAALLEKSWAPLARAAISATLGLGLAALYLIPAAWEQRWVQISAAIDDPSQRIENSWLFARHADPLLAAHDVVLRTVSIVAVTMIAVALCGLLVSWRRGALGKAQDCGGDRRRGPRRWWLPLAAIPFAVLFLELPLSLPVWHLLPRLRFLQFPWRWLVVLEAPMAVFFAAAVWPAGRRARTAVLSACVAAFLAATGFAAAYLFQVCYPEDTVASMLAAYRNGAGFEGMDEYAPPGADQLLIATGLPGACLVSDPLTVLGKAVADSPDSNPAWSPGDASCLATFADVDTGKRDPEHLRIRAAIPRAGYLVLRLRSYPAWRVRVNGRELRGLPWRDDGLMAVPVPQGPVELAVDWTTTADSLLGRWLSALALLLLTALGLLERKTACHRSR
jgi:hypothetical protein